MKLTIRFADQIVGGLIILALGILVFVIFMLGSSQRWFSRDFQYKTYFTSATGLTQNMAVQYKGFTIGHVKLIKLTEDDRVEVVFTIFDTYIDRAREGSLVEVLVSPIGGLGGNQFMFYPGLGSTLITEGETIPTVNSSEGKRLLAAGLAERPERDDSINNIMNRAGTLLATLNDLLLDVQDAFEGTDRTSLGRTLGNVEDRTNDFGEIMRELEPVLANLRGFSDSLADPDGSIMSVLDADGDVYSNLVSSLGAISGTLQNLEKTSDFIPAQLPQVAALLADLNIALQTMQDVLVAMTNNPLLKGGVPQRTQTRVGGTNDRDVEF